MNTNLRNRTFVDVVRDLLREYDLSTEGTWRQLVRRLDDATTKRENPPFRLAMCMDMDRPYTPIWLEREEWDFGRWHDDYERRLIYDENGVAYGRFDEDQCSCDDGELDPVTEWCVNECYEPLNETDIEWCRENNVKYRTDMPAL